MRATTSRIEWNLSPYWYLIIIDKCTSTTYTISSHKYPVICKYEVHKLPWAQKASSSIRVTHFARHAWWRHWTLFLTVRSTCTWSKSLKCHKPNLSHSKPMTSHIPLRVSTWFDDVSDSVHSLLKTDLMCVLDGDADALVIEMWVFIADNLLQRSTVAMWPQLWPATWTQPPVNQFAKVTHCRI